MPKLASLLALACVACAQTAVIGVPDDSLPMDAGADQAMDGGTELDLPATGVCATALADAPLRLVAVRFDGTTLTGLGADGRRPVLHRTFDSVPVRGERLSRGVLAAEGIVAGLAVAEERCERASCPLRGELFVLDALGVTTLDVPVPYSERLPGPSFVTEDGLVVWIEPTSPRGAAARMRAVDLDEGIDVEVPARVVTLHRGVADAAGWRLARLRSGEGRSSPPGFVHLGRGEIQEVPGGTDRSQALGSRWVTLEASRLHLDTRTGRRRTIELPRDLQNTSMGNHHEGLLELRRDGVFLALVDLDAERIIPLPEPLGPGTESVFGIVVRGTTALVSTAGLPVLRLDRATGRVETFDRPVVPDSHAVIDAAYCTPPATLLRTGAIGLTLRSEAHAGVFAWREGRLEPVGRPVRDVSWVSVVAAGDALASRGNTGRETFCPGVEPTDAPPAGDELVGDSLQLLTPTQPPRVLSPGDRLAYLDPDGECALVVPSDRSGVHQLLDLTTGEEAEWEDDGWWLPLVTAPLFPY